MTETEIWDQLVRIMRETFENDALVITRQTTARDVPDWDSLRNIELFVALQAAFRVKFRTGEIANLENVGAVADTIEARLSAHRT